MKDDFLGGDLPQEPSPYLPRDDETWTDLVRLLSSFSEDDLRLASTSTECIARMSGTTQSRSRLPSFASSSSIASNLFLSLSQSPSIMLDLNTTTNFQTGDAKDVTEEPSITNADVGNSSAATELMHATSSARASDMACMSESTKREWLAVTDSGIVSRSASVKKSLAHSSSDVPCLQERFATTRISTRRYFAIHEPLETIEERSDEENHEE